MTENKSVLNTFCQLKPNCVKKLTKQNKLSLVYTIVDNCAKLVGFKNAKYIIDGDCCF